jgi:Fe-S-cluster containining protein
LTSEQLFKKYLVIDYVQRSNERLYYPCPARKGDRRGTIVSSNWTFSDASCIFLISNRCAIEEVKPKGGRTLSCSLMTLDRNQIEYGKTKAALDWNNNHLLKQMMHIIESPSKVREKSKC